MALYQGLRNRLESGDVFLPHSFINKDFDEDLIEKVSPIAWRHIHIHGRYKFRIDKVYLDVLAMIKKVKI